jgi:enolase-phosphatase E1
VRELTGAPAASTGAELAALDAWLTADAKVAPLTTLQGRIWVAGFAAGDLTGVHCPDVAPALRRWHAARIVLVVYSSGSALAQRAWFGRAAALTPGAGPEDLRPSLTDSFALESAGPKTDPASHSTMAAPLDLVP